MVSPFTGPVPLGALFISAACVPDGDSQMEVREMVNTVKATHLGPQGTGVYEALVDV